MTKPGHDPDGVAKTEIDRFGNCSFCGALVDMRDMGQILAHIHEAEIEIGEGPPIARKIPTLTPKPNCSLIAAANPQGDTDARSGFGDIGDRAASIGGPAAAQTYAPGYPVCLHVYGPATYYECRYTSLPQCNASASGRAAQCVINPYFAGAEEPAGYRRHRRVY